MSDLLLFFSQYSDRIMEKDVQDTNGYMNNNKLREELDNTCSRGHIDPEEEPLNGKTQRERRLR